MHALEREVEAYSALAASIRHRDHLWLAASTRASVAILTGRFDDAERWANEAVVLGQHAPRVTVLGSYGLHLFVLRREQGRLAELEVFFLKRRPKNALFSVVWPSILALFYAELGRVEDARGEFEELAARDFADVPGTSVWPIAIGNLAEVCAFLGDAPRANLLYRLLLPSSGRNLVRGLASAPLCSADHYLGLLATTMSRWEQAARHFEAALAAHTRMRARPLIARVQHDHASMLVRSGAPADRSRAKNLLESSLTAARKLGMQTLVAKAEAIARELAAPSDDAEVAGRSVFRRQGDFWTIAHQGPSFALKDMKGLGCIARLLREPGREIHCLELLAEESASNPWAPEHRRRLAELQDDVAEAERTNDAGLQARARQEMDHLLAKLAGAAGLGGNDPDVGRAVQRARVNVSRTVKDAIAKIREHDQLLGRHLANSIRTGVFSSYTPEPGTGVRWSV